MRTTTSCNCRSNAQSAAETAERSAIRCSSRSSAIDLDVQNTRIIDDQTREHLMLYQSQKERSMRHRGALSIITGALATLALALSVGAAHAQIVYDDQDWTLDRGVVNIGEVDGVA